MEPQLMGLKQRSLITSSLIAGVVMGLFSAIPLIACVNCLLLAWVWGGGIFAVFLYRRREGYPRLKIEQGIVLGAFAGIIGAIIGGIFGWLLGGVSAAFGALVSQLAGDNSSFIPSFLLSTGTTVFSIITNMILYAVVGGIGGILATGLIWKAPSTPMAPPPTYNPPPAV